MVGIELVLCNGGGGRVCGGGSMSLRLIGGGSGRWSAINPRNGTGQDFNGAEAWFYKWASVCQLGKFV